MRPKGASDGWNSAPFRSVPYALRGLKPASTASDPWVFDERSRKFANFEETDVIENISISEMDNGGSGRLKFFKNYKDEPGRIGGREVEPWDRSTKTWS